MLELLSRENVDFGRNALVTLIGCALLGWICVRAVRGLRALDAAMQSVRTGTWPEPSALDAPRWPEWFAASCVCGVVAAHAQTIAAARALMPMLPPPPMMQKALAERFAGSLSWQLSAMAMSNFSVPFVLMGGAIAVALAFCARRRALGLQTATRLWQAGHHDAASAWLAYPGPNPLVAIAIPTLPLGLMLWPLWQGAGRFVGRFMMALGQAHDLPAGSDGAAFMAAASKEYRALMEPSLAFGFLGLLLGTLAAVVLVVWFDPARLRRALAAESAAHEPPSVGTWILSGVLVTLALAILPKAMALREENSTPWPRLEPGAVALPLPLETPRLAPSDLAPVAPLMALDGSSITLDGRAVDLGGLEEDLATMRRNWALLRPEQHFGGDILVACSPKTDVARIVEALQTAHRVGYSAAWFAFGRIIDHRRPVIGRLQIARTRFARVHAFAGSDAPSGSGTQPIAADAHVDCAGLSSSIVAARAQDKRVHLLLPAPTP